MSILSRYIQRLENTSQELEQVAIRAVADNKEFILDILKNDQLGEGIDSFGKDIIHPNGNAEGTYVPTTVNIWAKIDPPRTKKTIGGKFNMDWSGEFKDSMRIKTEKDGFDVLSITKSALERIYKTKLTALTEKNLKIVSDKVITPALYKHIFDTMSNLL